MKVLFNFSHPLSEVCQAQLREQIGQYLLHEIRVQLDLMQPVKPQVIELCQKAVRQSGEPDVICLPSLAIAAVLVDRFFSQPQDDYPPCVLYPQVVRLATEPGTTPPRWVLAEVI